MIRKILCTLGFHSPVLRVRDLGPISFDICVDANGNPVERESAEAVKRYMSTKETVIRKRDYRCMHCYLSLKETSFTEEWQ